MPDPMPTGALGATVSLAHALPERWGRWLFERPFLRVPDLLWERDGGEVLHVDEFVEDEVIVVRAELPGIDPERDLEVDVADDILRISAERAEDASLATRAYLHRELARGSARRVLPMPSGTRADTVLATYRDGVLEVPVPATATGTAGPAPVNVARR
jgi:HSP20 family protein